MVKKALFKALLDLPVGLRSLAPGKGYRKGVSKLYTSIHSGDYRNNMAKNLITDSVKNNPKMSTAEIANTVNKKFAAHDPPLKNMTTKMVGHFRHNLKLPPPIKDIRVAKPLIKKALD